jgi:bifunctional DNase/RNase
MIMSNAPTGPGESVGLMEEGGNRFLTLPVGRIATAVVRAAPRVEAEAAPGVPLLVELWTSAGTTLEEVRIEPLSDDILHASVQIRQAGGTRGVDARPADGIALAAQMGLPLSVADEIMRRDAWDLSGAREIVTRLQAVDEASLRPAVAEPFLGRIADGMLESLRRRTRVGEGNTFSKLVIELQQLGGPASGFSPLVYMLYHSDNGVGGGNVALPVSMLPVLIARFKQMANLDLAICAAPQEGETTVRLQGTAHRLRVATECTPLGEKVTLRLLAAEGQ